MNTIDHFLSRKAWAHMVWTERDRPTSIPGTDKSFHTGFDFRLERWAPEVYGKLAPALSSEGIVGQTNRGLWVYFQLTPGDPIMREATPEEVEQLERLPPGWEDHISLDTASTATPVI